MWKLRGAAAGNDALHAALLSFFDDRLTGLKAQSRLLVGCSSGPDSTALALVLWELQGRWPIRFELIHVNHGLRGRASEADERFVRRLGRRLGWPVHVLRRPVRTLKGNLEENARDARFAAFERVARRRRAAGVLLAHHGGDQAETIFMNLLRGTGPDGLAGMRPLRPLGPGRFVGRPLLSVSREQIADFLRMRKERGRSDRSNADVRFLRNWLRKAVLPALERRAPGFAARLGALADVIADEADVWSVSMADVERRELKRYRGGLLVDSQSLFRYPAAVQRRLLRRAAGGDLLTFAAVERWRRWMTQAPSGGRLWPLRKGWVVERLSKTRGSPSSTLYWLRPGEDARRFRGGNPKRKDKE